MSNPRPPRPKREEPFRLLMGEKRTPVPTVEQVVNWPSADTGSDEEPIEDLDVEPMTTDDRIEAVDRRIGELETKQDLTRREIALVNTTLEATNVAVAAVAGRLDDAMSRSKMSGATRAVTGVSIGGLVTTLLVDNQSTVLAVLHGIRSWFGH